VFRNNVCYGAQAGAITLTGGNATITGNVLIAPDMLWRGGIPSDSAVIRPKGVFLHYPQANITVSGNYVEGSAYGLVIGGGGDDSNPKMLSGTSITHNTIAGGPWSDAYFFGGSLPAIMNANQWGGNLASFNIFGQKYGYSQFLAWAQAKGIEQQSAGTVGPLISAPSYDQQLDANPTLDQIMSLFQGYATAQINSYPPSTIGVQPSALTGTTTLDANGTAPLAANLTYDFSTGTVLTVDAVHGLLSGSNDDYGEALIAAPAAGPAHGALIVNLDGSFVYTPALGYDGTDSFMYQVSDGHGGTALATVTLLDPSPPTGGFQVTAFKGMNSGLKTVATFACPGAVPRDFTATIAWGDGHASPGMITSDGSGGFIVSGSNTYAVAGSYAISVAVGDASGATQSTTSTVSVVDAIRGDANLDGTVGFNDLSIVLTNYNKTGVTWSQGDFTGDGVVDINDVIILLTNYNESVGLSGIETKVSPPGAGEAAVPDPLSMAAANHVLSAAKAKVVSSQTAASVGQTTTLSPIADAHDEVLQFRTVDGWLGYLTWLDDWNVLGTSYRMSKNLASLNRTIDAVFTDLTK
jgi:hypothetical protein